MKKSPATKAAVLLSVVLLLLSNPLTHAIVPSEPHPANAIWIEPSTITLTDYNIGDKFNITAYLNMTTLEEGANGITTWQVVVYYNTTYINATRVGFTGPGYTVSELFQGKTAQPATRIEPDKKRAGCGEALIGATNYVPVPVVASLCWIEFEVIALEPQPVQFALNIDNSLTFVGDDVLPPNYYPPSGDTGLYDATVTIPVTYPLTITSTTGGTTDPAPGTHLYPEETSVNVTAIPDLGYSFDYWLLNGTQKTENPITIKMNASYTLEAYFVDDVPPEIGEPVQDPPKDNVQPNQPVTVRVNVTDYGVGVKNVTLWYSTDNGTTWLTPINMTKIAGTDTYNATIPGYENCTWVTYKIIAYDNEENQATKVNNNVYKYHVIPEYTSILILALFMAVTLIATALWKIKRKLDFPHFLCVQSM
ncbi:MAG: hypothetical protein QXI91_02100 [Candidatus Bathyarchaeia archaeon]